VRTRLKVCCIASPEEARLAIAHGADALGLVGQMPSGPGPIDDALIAEIARLTPPPVATFLLTSRTEPEDVVSHVLATGVNTVQLVDEVPDETYRLLRARAPRVRIVQVLHVQDAGRGGDVIGEARRIEAHVDALLLDSGRPNAAVKELGGTGRTHDWSVSARLVASVKRPVFLAGGIRPENIGEAVRAVRPFGIDLCSGVRVNGRLDAGKLARLAAQLREADEHLHAQTGAPARAQHGS
jgi:phosphoribosylanthranilate isomerase